MQLIIEHRNLELNKHLHNLVQHRFEHLEKIYRLIKKSVVILKKEINGHAIVSRIEARVLFSGKMVYAGAQGETFETALHKVIDGLSRQLHRHRKERQEIW